jgi:hypothetical protein
MFDFVHGLPYLVTLQFLSWYSDTAGATSVPLDSRCLSCGAVRFGPKYDPWLAQPAHFQDVAQRNLCRCCH